MVSLVLHHWCPDFYLVCKKGLLIHRTTNSKNAIKIKISNVNLKLFRFLYVKIIKWSIVLATLIFKLSFRLEFLAFFTRLSLAGLVRVLND